MTLLETIRDAALTTFYPTACRVCGSMVESWRDGIACAKCWDDADSVCTDLDICVKCGAWLESLPSNSQHGERRCGRCHDFAFDVARSCGPYEGALRESVLWLKSHPQISPRLRDLIESTFHLHDELRESQSIIPMPLHPSRLAERGFNQAEIIAEGLASAIRLRVDSFSVIRVKQTARHRAGMGMRERSRSLEGSFNVRAPRFIANRIILIVDDVMTTSGTAHELSRTLIDGGARKVNVLTIGRVGRENAKHTKMTKIAK